MKFKNFIAIMSFEIPPRLWPRNSHCVEVVHLNSSYSSVAVYLLPLFCITFGLRVSKILPLLDAMCKEMRIAVMVAIMCT